MTKEEIVQEMFEFGENVPPEKILEVKSGILEAMELYAQQQTEELGDSRVYTHEVPGNTRGIS